MGLDITKVEGAPKRNKKADFGEKVKAHQRYYASDGQMLPGSTTVIGVLGLGKDRLIRWANHKGLEGIDTDKYKDEAADSGTCLHYLVECYLINIEPRLDDFTPAQVDRARIGLDAFKRWREAEAPDLKPIATELRLVSDTKRYGGTLDLYCTIRDRYTLVDYKTSTGVYLEHKVQVTSYVKLAQENGRRVQDAIIIQLPQVEGGDAIPHALNKRHAKLYWQLFELCLAIHSLNKVIRKEGG